MILENKWDIKMEARGNKFGKRFFFKGSKQKDRIQTNLIFQASGTISNTFGV